MGRYIGSRSKICKRVGRNIYDNPKFDAIVAEHKSHKKMGKKPSEYSLQLQEKQLARYLYGVSEKQFKKYFDKAHRSEGVTGVVLLRLLECRLDNVLYRAGLASSRSQARQMVAHGHFELNGHKATIPSIIVKAGDQLKLRNKMVNSPLYVIFSEAKSVKWINLDHKKKTILVERLPEEDELEKIINVQIIVEFYSR